MLHKRKEGKQANNNNNPTINSNSKTEGQQRKIINTAVATSNNLENKQNTRNYRKGKYVMYYPKYW